MQRVYLTLLIPYPELPVDENLLRLLNMLRLRTELNLEDARDKLGVSLPLKNEACVARRCILENSFFPSFSFNSSLKLIPLILASAIA